MKFAKKLLIDSTKSYRYGLTASVIWLLSGLVGLILLIVISNPSINGLEDILVIWLGVPVLFIFYLSWVVAVVALAYALFKGKTSRQGKLLSVASLLLSLVMFWLIFIYTIYPGGA